MELAQLASVDVEGDSLLLVLAHDLVEDRPVRVKLALLLVDELSGEEALRPTRAIVLSGLSR